MRRRFNFEVHLIDSCNLNCKGCLHFSPLAKPNSFYPFEEFKKEIERLAELFDGKFGWIHLLGGEPLLNPRIEDYLDVIGSNVKKGRVDIITNGLLIKKMPASFFEKCKKYGIIISITKYPINLNYEEIEEFVKGYGCQIEFYGDKTKETSFMTASLVANSTMSYKKNYLDCKFSNACVTLYEGKLYYCSLPAYARFYNEEFGDTFDYSHDSISIYDHGKKEILDFLRKPHEFCKYCDLKYRQSHKMRWDLSKRVKEEWIIDEK